MVVQRWFGALAIPLLLLASGCAHTSQIAFRYDADGKPSAYERRERNITRDFWHHFTRTVYCSPADGFDENLSADQHALLDKNGPPDWTRCFTSFEGESVVEWIYVDKSIDSQFINGQEIFRGPLTDYVQILLSHGRPSRAIRSDPDTADRVDFFVYDGVFMPDLQQYHFLNDTITQKHEGD